MAGKSSCDSTSSPIEQYGILPLLHAAKVEQRRDSREVQILNFRRGKLKRIFGGGTRPNLSRTPGWAGEFQWVLPWVHWKSFQCLSLARVSVRVSEDSPKEVLASSCCRRFSSATHEPSNGGPNSQLAEEIWMLPEFAEPTYGEWHTVCGMLLSAIEVPKRARRERQETNGACIVLGYSRPSGTQSNTFDCVWMPACVCLPKRFHSGMIIAN